MPCDGSTVCAKVKGVNALLIVGNRFRQKKTVDNKGFVQPLDLKRIILISFDLLTENVEQVDCLFLIRNGDFRMRYICEETNEMAIRRLAKVSSLRGSLVANLLV